MVFVDVLGMGLMLLAVVGITGAYIVAKTMIVVRKGGNPKDELRYASAPLLILGFIVLVIGLYSDLTWPLTSGNPPAPTSSNILFFDVFLLLGALLLGWGWSFNRGYKLDYMAIASLVGGLATVWYGINGYVLHMAGGGYTLLSLYTVWGLGGIMTFPMALSLNRAMSTSEDPPQSRRCVVCMVTLSIFLVLAALSAGATFVSAIPAHLLKAP